MEKLLPVPYQDDGYANYQLEICRNDQNSFDQELTIISIVAAASVFFMRIRNKEHRKFPDNMFTMSLLALCGLHVALLISIASNNKVVLLHFQPWSSLCDIQAVMFHWCSCASIWNIICVILTLNRVIVHKTTVTELVRFSRLYYATLLGLPSLAVAACWLVGGGYGPYPGLHNCWIKPGAGRLLFFHPFTMFAIVTFLIFGPPTLIALYKASRRTAQPANAGLFRSLMVRQILLALYGLSVVTTFFLGGLNGILIKTNKNSAYVKKSAYPVCLFSAINFASLGLFVSIIYWSTKHQSQLLRATIDKFVDAACCRRSSSNRPTESDDQEDAVVMGISQDDADAKTKFTLRQTPLLLPTRSSSPSLLSVDECEFRSAFDSGGRSVVSIPRDAQPRRAIQIATNAYTSTLLEYVREQLLDELQDAEDSSDDSAWGSSAFDDDSDSHGSFCSSDHDFRDDDRSSHTGSSNPTTPQCHFYQVSPRVDVSSPMSQNGTDCQRSSNISVAIARDDPWIANIRDL